MNTMNI